ncbi:MAG: tRNA (adenosine(37)-N6)-threonylcarbamoyltransferase complex ATPase subunit type 1 TsaE [Desulfotalea sp.]|nr:MAG: tRNA (adenosine(37)-N6)-threonylcarbamoyltransferase complex ATPase subunit type 1 TsaE [Desulfotalea sp.]
MESYTFTAHSLEQTQKFGHLLGAYAKPDFVYCLDGDLGAGKTTLTQAIAGGLDLDDGEYISSPSFAIMHEYPGSVPLYHMDFYRLYGADDVLALGFDEYFFKKGLTVIEWSQRAPEILPEELLTVEITRVSDNSRFFALHATPLYIPLLQKISTHFPATD